MLELDRLCDDRARRNVLPDRHFQAFEAMGATVRLNGGFEIEAAELSGAGLFLDEPSVTATENALMTAVLAKGELVLRNAAA